MQRRGAVQNGEPSAGAQMVELFVMCPECRLHARLRNSWQEVADPEGKCKHRQNAGSCPNLVTPLSNARKMLRDLERGASVRKD